MERGAPRRAPLRRVTKQTLWSKSRRLGAGHSSVVQMSASPRVIWPRAWPDWSLHSARSTARCLSGVSGAGRAPAAARESARGHHPRPPECSQGPPGCSFGCRGRCRCRSVPSSLAVVAFRVCSFALGDACVPVLKTKVNMMTQLWLMRWLSRSIWTPRTCGTNRKLMKRAAKRIRSTLTEIRMGANWRQKTGSVQTLLE